eukprot:m.50144 g.50144  ORF g.50144 m.50144 type:complete len:501 (-) comp10649_c0_seq1:1559-3061(-)
MNTQNMTGVQVNQNDSVFDPDTIFKDSGADAETDVLNQAKLLTGLLYDKYVRAPLKEEKPAPTSYSDEQTQFRNEMRRMTSDQDDDVDEGTVEDDPGKSVVEDEDSMEATLKMLNDRMNEHLAAIEKKTEFSIKRTEKQLEKLNEEQKEAEDARKRSLSSGFMLGSSASPRPLSTPSKEEVHRTPITTHVPKTKKNLDSSITSQQALPSGLELLGVSKEDATALMTPVVIDNDFEENENDLLESSTFRKPTQDIAFNATSSPRSNILQQTVSSTGKKKKLPSLPPNARKTPSDDSRIHKIKNETGSSDTDTHLNEIRPRALLDAFQEMEVDEQESTKSKASSADRTTATRSPLHETSFDEMLPVSPPNSMNATPLPPTPQEHDRSASSTPVRERSASTSVAWAKTSTSNNTQPISLTEARQRSQSVSSNRKNREGRKLFGRSKKKGRRSLDAKKDISSPFGFQHLVHMQEEDAIRVMSVMGTNVAQPATNVGSPMNVWNA